MRLPRSLVNMIRFPQSCLGLAALLVTSLSAAATTTSFPVSAPAVQGQDAVTDRELAAISEEQAMLLRQLQRLRNTMEVLLDRIEAEGRARTADLLRQALTMLDERAAANAAGSPLTMEERMEQARSTLAGGQVVQSLERQRELVLELDRLLSILLDRKNLESLEDKIAERRAMQEQLGELADRESELRKETDELRNDSSNETQKTLEQTLEELYKEQRGLLEETESIGRKAGTLGLEQLEKELARLIRDQGIDIDVLEGWQPQEAGSLDRASEELSRALLAEAQAKRLRQAAEELLQAAVDLDSTPTATEKVGDELADEAVRADRHSKVSSDPAAKLAAEELRQAVARLQEARDAPGSQENSPAALSKELRDRAEALKQAADRSAKPAQDALQKAKDALSELSKDPDRGSAEGAAEIEEMLDRAREAAQSPERQDEAAHATRKAAGALEELREDLSFLGEALAGSQAEAAERAERLKRNLETLPQAETEAGERARSALQRAAGAMRQASGKARAEEAENAGAQAQQALRELESARTALEDSRNQSARAGSAASEAVAQQQKAAARKAKAARSQVSKGSMTPKAQDAVGEALEEAEEAMERAAEELDQGRSASAAGSQRQAMQALRRASQEAHEGVSPQSQEDQARAEELAQEQERIRQELLDLARRIRERDNARPTPSLDRADQAAQEAQSELRQGDLGEAQEQEQKVEQELRQTQEQLKEEEEQYQKLREEEQLFRIAEDVQEIINEHREHMVDLREIHKGRKTDRSPSRAQKLRLRRLSRKESGLAARADEIAEAIKEEGAMVAGELMAEVSSDLNRIARNISDEGEYQTGERVQGLQRDVEEALLWLLEALQREQSRRQQNQSDQQEQDQQGQNRPSIIPDSAELKLLRRMELDTQQAVEQFLTLHPDLEHSVADDPYLLDDVARLGGKHEKITELFQQLRDRVGIPAPEDDED